MEIGEGLPHTPRCFCKSAQVIALVGVVDCPILGMGKSFKLRGLRASVIRKILAQGRVLERMDHACVDAGGASPAPTNERLALSEERESTDRSVCAT